MSISTSRSIRGSQSLSMSGGFGTTPFKATKVRQERQTNFKVVIRVRPPLPRELSGEIPFRNVVAIDDREQCITVSENIDAVLDSEGNLLANPGPYVTQSFMFDYVYDQSSSQAKVYETSARTVVDSALQGYNATIFAYGQTGSGKTYTMEGFNRRGNIEERGIIPRAIEQIFGHIQQHASPRMRFLVRASYLQIYKELISDLLKPERNNLLIREDKRRGVYVEGLSEWVVRSPAEIYGLMERGASIRATGETKMNELSSRSHAVFIIIVEQSETVYTDDHGNELSPEDFQGYLYQRGIKREQEMNRMEDHIKQTFKVGKLNLVDLAGSERVNLSGATGERLEESKKINLSLTMLGFVISALTKEDGASGVGGGGSGGGGNGNRENHIPYRNSKLTRMLEDSLGGNCKTTMMAMISPAFEAMMESIYTLKFANRAKSIRNEAKVNEDLDQKSLLRKYERELKKLRAELEEKNKNVVDKRRLLELDEQRKRAEADKMAAIKALEQRSMEFMKEKEEKKKLEQRIQMLTSQMLRGERGGGGPGGAGGAAGMLLEGGGGAGNGEEEIMMKEQQDRLRQQYEFKLADLERERVNIEEEKAQVDRYKQLLLKQRDIMIALTQRLVERDEQIMALQDELDAYDRHHKELEEKLDEKTALLIKLQRISMEVNANSPTKNEELSEVITTGKRSANASTTAAPMAAAPKDRTGGRSSGPTEVEEAEEDGLDSPDIIASPPPASSSSSTVPNRGRFSNNNNSNNNNNNREEMEALQAKLSQQSMQISSLEHRLAENTLTSTRVERVLGNELESYLRTISNDSARTVIREPMKVLIQQAMQKMRETATLLPPSPLVPSLAAAAGNSINGQQQQQQQQLKALQEENDQLKTKLKQQQPQQANTPADVTKLQSRCDTLVKEREAVQTIMEHKIKVLVQSVAQAASAVMMQPTDNHAASQALAKDVAALQKLVNAAIAALRNAANNNNSNTQQNNQNSNGNSSSYNSNSSSYALPSPSPPAPGPSSFGGGSSAGAALLSSSSAGSMRMSYNGSSSAQPASGYAAAYASNSSSYSNNSINVPVGATPGAAGGGYSAAYASAKGGTVSDYSFNH